jgi:hypothetical protein
VRRRRVNTCFEIKVVVPNGSDHGLKGYLNFDSIDPATGKSIFSHLLFVMRPHTDDLYRFDFIQHLIYKSVLDIDAP